MNHPKHRYAVALWVTALFICLALAVALHPGTPGYEPTIGIANHNPGNIRDPRWQAWKGSVGVDPWGHIIFSDKRWGLRAIRMNLAAYRKRGIRTPREIAERWGSAEAGAAEKSGYTRMLCQAIGAWPDQPLDMMDPHTLRRIARGIVRQENGRDPYTAADYARAFP